MHDEQDEPPTPLAPDDPLAGLVERELARRMEPRAKARVAAKLGLGGGGGGPTPHPSVLGRTLGVLGTAGALVVLGIVGWSQRHVPTAVLPSSPTPELAATVQPQVVSDTAGTAAGAEPEIAAEASTETAARPSVEPARDAPHRAPRVEEPPSEIELLARARAELASHPRTTLRLCTQHEALHPQGVLREEREVLVIDALLATDARAAAEARAQRFRRDFPHSVHERHVEQALEQADSR